MEKEIAMMKERHVWDLKEKPSNLTPVGCRWVYTLKRDADGNIARYKARLVAQGYKQIKGESYEETFSPVVNFSVIRLFFALLTIFNKWINVQCDISCAYLYAPLNETVYMNQPPGYIQSGKENFFCKLNKAIYGLHQSGRMWFYEIHKILILLGFIKLSACNCVYTFQSKLLLLLYVDDIVIFGKNQKIIDKVLGLIKNHFDIKILGCTKKLLGVEFDYTDENLFLHQQQYISEVCERFQNFNYPISSLPIVKGTIYSKSNSPSTQSEIKEMSKIPYRNLLGSLAFIANRTRPDIAYAVNIFSQFQSNPGIVHWNGLLKLLGYVASTKNYKLNLNCNQTQIIGYSDADFASNRDDRTSMGGQIIFLGQAPIDWRTFKEKTVSLSTMEAEFIAMTESVKNLVWFDRILQECVEKKLICDKCPKSLLKVDNQAAIDFVKSPVENYRSKHIDVKLFFIRDLIFKEEFILEYVRSKSNLADAFTKPLTKAELFKFIKGLYTHTIS